MGETKEKTVKYNRLVIGTVVGVLTVLNIGFGIINLKAVTSSEKDSTAAAQSSLDDENSFETDTEASQSETTLDSISEAEQDPRRSVGDSCDNLGIIKNVNNFLNIRQEPNSESISIGKAMKHAGVNVVSETDNGWYLIESQGMTGYVSKDYVAAGEEGLLLAMEFCENNAQVKNSTMDVYKSVTKDSEVLFTATQGNAYKVLDILENWVKVRITDGLEGYVERDQVDIAYTLQNPIFFGYDGGVSELRLNIINKAWEYYGGAYVWGGTELGVGVDCSGFMLRIYEMFGINLSRLSSEQAKNGVEVSEIEMRPGDLLFFYGYINGVKTDGVGHVAMYIGDGKMIHAASASRGIVVDNWDYIGAPLYIRNVIGD